MKKNKLSVAIIAPSFGEMGGPEVVAKTLAQALKKEGVNVTLFAPGDWKTNLKHIPTLEKNICNMALADKKGKIESLVIKSQMKVLDYQQP